MNPLWDSQIFSESDKSQMHIILPKPDLMKIEKYMLFLGLFAYH